MKRFVTIFPWAENIHIMKSEGEIPYWMHRKYGYESRIVTYKNAEDYSYINDEVKGLSIEFIKDTGRFLSAEKAVIGYLLRSAWKIDVLNLYHFTPATLLYCFLYRFLNPMGRVFLKLDMDTLSFKGFGARFEKNGLMKAVVRLIVRLAFAPVKVISIETRAGEETLAREYPWMEKKLVRLPNGFDREVMEKKCPRVRAFGEKENIIITAGRLGTYQKNSEMLLQALALMGLSGWKVFFIGAVDPVFEPYKINFFKAHPELAGSVVFTGNIGDKSVLYDYYNRAKIFCLTSRFESFGNVMIEALHFGCCVVTTGVISAADITDTGKAGVTVPQEDFRKLSGVLQGLMSGQKVMEEMYPRAREHSRNFYWENIVELLESRLK